ncbi:MAG: hypothetical protein AAGB34_08360 [Planctomycetota bacterium]
MPFILMPGLKVHRDSQSWVTAYDDWIDRRFRQPMAVVIVLALLLIVAYHVLAWSWPSEVTFATIAVLALLPANLSLWGLRLSEQDWSQFSKEEVEQHKLYSAFLPLFGGVLILLVGVSYLYEGEVQFFGSLFVIYGFITTCFGVAMSLFFGLHRLEIAQL